MSILIVFAFLAVLALLQLFGMNIMSRDEWITAMAVVLAISFAVIIYALIDNGVME